MGDKEEILLSYIRANVAPILVDFIFGKDINGAVVLPANVDVKELNGHYDGTEQLKFCELLEHRKISTFELPKSCVIIVTANEINKDKINEEIFSLVARI